MPSAVQKGQYWQRRTQVWLERQGYVVGLLQRMYAVWTPSGRQYTKRDQFGSDLLAVSTEKTVFVQVKGGTTWRSGLAAARASFASFPLSASSEQWIVGWSPNARQPEIEIVAVGPQPADHAVQVPARRKPKRLPLLDRAV